MANIRLAQAFNPILSQFEVILRNSLCLTMSAHFANHDWIINQKAAFMSHYSLSSSHYFLGTSVRKTESNLTHRAIPTRYC